MCASVLYTKHVNWNFSENTVLILFVGDGFPSLCIAAYLPLRPTLLGDFPLAAGGDTPPLRPYKFRFVYLLNESKKNPV